MATRKRPVSETASWTASTAAATAAIVCTLLSASRSVVAFSDCQALTALEGNGSLTSPGYPEFYRPNKRCSWTLTAEEGKVVRLLILDIDLEESYDYLEIYSGTSSLPSEPLQRLTGTMMYIESTFSASLTLVFRSDDSVEWRGFQVFFDSVYPPGSTESAPKTCGAVLRNSAVITTPNYPNAYSKDTVCTWSLQAEEGKVVKLRFKDFDLGRARDSLIVQSTDSQSTGTTRLTGSVVPPVMLLGHEALLVFNSTGVLQYAGFLLVFTSACESTLTNQGNITSPNYPGYYPSFATCLWSLKASQGGIVTMTFNSFDLEPDDAVEVYDISDNLISRYTGRNTTGGFSSSFNMSAVTLAFYSNTEDARKGGFSAFFGSKALA